MMTSCINGLKTGCLGRSKIIIATWLMAIAIYSFQSGMVLAQTARWTVDVSNKAEVLLPGGTWQVLNANTELVPGSEVKVGVGGRVILKKNGDIVTLSPNSQLKLPAASVADGPSILQKLGTLLYKIRKRDLSLLQTVSASDANSPFKVDTPYLAAVIKGTVFSVNVTQQGSALHVTEGLVEAISVATGERGLVRPGQTARVSSLAGSRMTISHGGKINGKAKGSDANGRNDQEANAEADNGGLKAAVDSGPLDVSRSSKGLLKVNGGSGQKRIPGVPDVSKRGKIKTSKLVTAEVPGLNASNGNGNGNGNGKGNNGSNGCNGKGKKPGC